MEQRHVAHHPLQEHTTRPPPPHESRLNSAWNFSSLFLCRHFHFKDTDQEKSFRERKQPKVLGFELKVTATPCCLERLSLIHDTVWPEPERDDAVCDRRPCYYNIILEMRHSSDVTRRRVIVVLLFIRSSNLIKAGSKLTWRTELIPNTFGFIKAAVVGFTECWFWSALQQKSMDPEVKAEVGLLPLNLCLVGLLVKFIWWYLFSYHSAWVLSQNF